MRRALTPDEVRRIREGNKMTFAPRSNGQCVCNQAPELGRLSKSQRRALEAQVWPTHPRASRTSGESVEPRYTTYSQKYKERGVTKSAATSTRHTVTRDERGLIVCPECSHPMLAAPGDVPCKNCFASLRAVSAEPRARLSVW